MMVRKRKGAISFLFLPSIITLKNSTINVNKSNINIFLVKLHLISKLLLKFNQGIKHSKQKVKHPHRNPAFVTGAYSDAVIVNGFIFVSGQASVDFNTSTFVLGTIEEETRRTLDNIKLILQEAGASMDNIVKCTVHLNDIREFDRYNAVYAAYFPGIKPARTTVQSVLAEGIKVEIDCIAYIPDQQ